MVEYPGDKQAHAFGGKWTDVKLNVLSGYLKAYNDALKSKSFSRGYIDAFAGTGYRNLQNEQSPDRDLLFPDLAESEPQDLLDGSARIALRTEPRFDGYVFVERNDQRCTALEQLKSEFRDRADSIQIRQGDANHEVQKICQIDWTKRRAVLFLDPYGMQVEWETIRAVAETKAIDMWLLFPLGIGINRLLLKSGDVPLPWRTKIDRLLGTVDWYDEFYRREKETDMFGNETESVIKASMETIGHYFVKRLESVFAGVARAPGVLRNSANNPLYMLCFAMGNKRGKSTGLRIANHLLKDLR